MTDGFAWLDATGQAELVARGEVHPIELVDAAIARIEKLNPELNAVIVTLFDEARRAALSEDLPDGPFRGVPLLLKDLGDAIEGAPQYSGNRALRDIDYRSPYTTVLVSRLQRAGFITVGKTNTPEFGIQATTQPVAFGATRNPWDTTRSPNGSSGGSAAAVASGMVALAHGTDGGGSIRMPAAWCGLVGLKPSRGRVSLGAGAGTNRHAVGFVMSRTVRDTAGVLDAVHGPAPGDLFLVPPPERPYAEEVGVPVGRLRVGVLFDSGLEGVDPPCIAALEATAALLEDLGHTVEPAWPGSLFDRGDPDLDIKMRTLSDRGTLKWLAWMLDRPVREDDVEPYLWQRAHRDVEVSGAEVLRAQQEEHLRGVAIAEWWAEGFDALLTPTVYEPPAPLEELVPPVGREIEFVDRVRWTSRLTMPFNMTGQPAISLPLAWTEDGLPIGMQFVAAIGREDLLLRLGSQLEAAQRWADRRPPVSV